MGLPPCALRLRVVEITWAYKMNVLTGPVVSRMLNRMMTRKTMK